MKFTTLTQLLAFVSASAAALSPSAYAKTAICAGQTVYGNYGSHVVGVVTRVFEDERAEVRWTRLNGNYYSGKVSYWKVGQLWARTSCTSDNRICEGNSVFGRNGNHMLGTVQRIFENDIVEVQWNVLNGMAYAGHLSYWPGHGLAREAMTRCAQFDNCQSAPQQQGPAPQPVDPTAPAEGEGPPPAIQYPQQEQDQTQTPPPVEPVPPQQQDQTPPPPVEPAPPQQQDQTPPPPVEPAPPQQQDQTPPQQQQD